MNCPTCPQLSVGPLTLGAKPGLGGEFTYHTSSKMAVLCEPSPYCAEGAVGGHAADVQTIVVLGCEGSLGVGALLYGEDVVVLDARAGTGDVGDEAADVGELREVVGVGVPEIAVGASVVVAVGDVDAACGRPHRDVVAFLDFESCELLIVVAGRGCRDHLGLGPLLALVEPNGAAEDN